jgi:hypothetical protein
MQDGLERSLAKASIPMAKTASHYLTCDSFYARRHVGMINYMLPASYSPATLLRYTKPKTMNGVSLYDQQLCNLMDKYGFYSSSMLPLVPSCINLNSALISFNMAPSSSIWWLSTCWFRPSFRFDIVSSRESGRFSSNLIRGAKDETVA